MHKRYDLLETIASKLRGSEDSDKRRLPPNMSGAAMKDLLDRLCDYYSLLDIDTGEIHGKIFRALYINEDFSSYDAVAWESGVHVWTLDRYRRRYNALARRLWASYSAASAG